MTKKNSRHGLLGPLENLGFPASSMPSDGRDDLIEAQGKYIEVLEMMGTTDRAAAAFAVGKLAKRKEDQRSGGRKTGQQRRQVSAEWHPRAIKTAKRLIDAGRKPHELTAIVATQLGKSADVVRPVLQDAGLVRKRRAS